MYAISCQGTATKFYQQTISNVKKIASDWLYIYPSEIRDILIRIKIKYNNPIIYVAENGISNDGKIPLDENLKDNQRTQAYIDHLSYLRKTIEEGVDVRGFFVWSLLENFEWNCGYTVRFGIYHVDFKDGLKRHPKKSAIWFKSYLQK
ncbi:beta-glucosidase 13-like [Macadamia integrifolia]|uniref:beta-glucosidase 13-like n=1 Tax=Macadamia integrifolia TaxID=60698 RepID=UPI001C4F6155|nr:beta-glucosidase 13-like [Macadamia integrifolia]